MEIFIPQTVVTLLEYFRQVFTTPSYRYFCAMIWSLMLVEDRKCITKLAQASFFIRRDISSWERFLSCHRWSLFYLRMKLVELMIFRLQEALWVYGAYLCVIDTTHIAKSGKMLGTQKWHDHSGNPDRGEYIIGHHWGIIGLISRHSQRYLCWPMMLCLIPGLKAACQWMVGTEVVPMRFWDACLALLWSFQDALGKSIPLRVVADAYFSKAPFINGVREKGQHLVSRLRWDAVAKGDPKPHEQKPRGRKRKYGIEFKLADLLKTKPLETLEVNIYGKTKQIEVVCCEVWLRNVKEKVKVVVAKGKTKPVIFISTDRDLKADQIVEIYAARFSVELAIRDLKGNFGLGDYQASNFLSIYRFVHLCCTAFCLWRLSLLKDQDAPWLNDSKTQFICESDLSFKRVRRALRRFVMQKIISTNFADHGNFQKSETEMVALL